MRVPALAVQPFDRICMANSLASTSDLKVRVDLTEPDAGSSVFTAPSAPVPLDTNQRWWRYVERASWRHPLGPGSNVDGRERLPVVHVAYEDAEAYARWAGKIGVAATVKWLPQIGTDNTVKGNYVWFKLAISL